MSLPDAVDVVVVGAGLAGLRAARTVARAGRSVAVCEAGEGVGGRVRTDVVDGFLVDRGFQILNTSYPALKATVDLDALDLRPFVPGAAVRDADGRLHREDGPALILPSGREEWYRHGKLHRDDGPAVVHANGSVKWYRHGRRHREGAPACVYVNGTEKWYRDGLRHRDDGPAATYPDERRIWFRDGVKVRQEPGRPSGQLASRTVVPGSQARASTRASSRSQ
jgi:glycine/D-amino acid oxidase-like deaminating enzyme